MTLCGFAAVRPANMVDYVRTAVVFYYRKTGDE